MNFSEARAKRGVAAALCGVVFILLAGTLASLVLDESPYYLFVNQHRYDAEIAQAAQKHQLPPALIRALILRESRFNSRAVGGKGEIGLMQLLPGRSGAVADWSQYHRKPQPQKFELFDVAVNLDIGAWYLGRALKRWRNYRCAEELALAEYNAGFRRTKKWKPEKTDGEVIPRITLPETRRYVTFIMRHYRKELGTR